MSNKTGGQTNHPSNISHIALEKTRDSAEKKAQQIPLQDIVQRADSDLSSLLHTDVLQLQRAIGNRSVDRILSETDNHAIAAENQALKPTHRIPIQTKLTVGPANDKYEQEADLVAKDVVKQINSPAAGQSVQPFSEPRAQRQGPEAEDELLQGKRIRRQPEEEEELLQGKPLQRQPEEEEELLQGKLETEIIQLQTTEEEEELLQGKLEAGRVQRQEEEEELMAKPDIQLVGREGGDADSKLEAAIQKERSGGQPISDGVREPLENALGTDLSHVKIHTNSESDSLNASLQSRAFTTGSHIFFKRGEFNPYNTRGQELIAHELVHTAQQGETNRIARWWPKGHRSGDRPPGNHHHLSHRILSGRSQSGQLHRARKSPARRSTGGLGHGWTGSGGQHRNRRTPPYFLYQFRGNRGKSP